MGAVYACLEACGTAGAVDLQQLVHRGEVETDRAGVLATDPGLHATDHRASTAERNDREVRCAGPVEHVDDVGFGPRAHHEVGDGLQVTEQRAHNISEGLAVAVSEPIARLVSHDARQASWCPDSARWQIEGIDRRSFVRRRLKTGEQISHSADERIALTADDGVFLVAPTPP
jgi:hypothetical protein